MNSIASLVYSVYEFYRVEFIKQVKSQINTCINSDNSNELHTIYTCKYDNYVVHAEAIYFTRINDSVIFFIPTTILRLTLDNELLVTDAVYDYTGDLMFDYIYEDSSEIIYIDNLCDSNGRIFELYTFNNEELEQSKYIISNKIYPFDVIIPDVDEYTEMALDFLNERINSFKDQVDKSFELEEPIAELDENPYANDYYDGDISKKRRSSPITSRKSLGNRIDGSI